MPIYDYQCEMCGLTEEHYVDPTNRMLPCPRCGCWARRIFSSGHTFANQGTNIYSENPAWLKDTIQIVDKEGGQHCQEFIRNPTRENYHNWMKGEGLRPLERGEKGGKSKSDYFTKEQGQKRAERLFRQHQQRNRIELGGRG